MAALSKAGIYVIADVGLPLNGSINRAVPSWYVSFSSRVRLLTAAGTSL